MSWNDFLNLIISWATNTGIKIVIAVLILLISFKIINVVSRKLFKKIEKKNVDKTLSRTLLYLFKILLKCVIVVCLIGYLGIDTSGITALIASLGVCVGLAVNGALSNLAGGALILITRPFKVDDYIEAQGYSGTVEEIRITNTKIKTPDNKTIYIPNGALSSGSIINYNEKGLRRLDLTFSIAYNNDFNKAKEIINEIVNDHPLILKDNAPLIRVSSHSSSSIDIATKVWVKSDDYWTVNFDLLEKVKTAFDENNVEIPFNQLDVHVKND